MALHCCRLLGVAILTLHLTYSLGIPLTKEVYSSDKSYEVLNSQRQNSIISLDPEKSQTSANILRKKSLLLQTTTYEPLKSPESSDIKKENEYRQHLNSSKQDAESSTDVTDKLGNNAIPQDEKIGQEGTNASHVIVKNIKLPITGTKAEDSASINGTNFRSGTKFRLNLESADEHTTLRPENSSSSMNEVRQVVKYSPKNSTLIIQEMSNDISKDFREKVQTIEEKIPNTKLTDDLGSDQGETPSKENTDVHSQNRISNTDKTTSTPDIVGEIQNKSSGTETATRHYFLTSTNKVLSSVTKSDQLRTSSSLEEPTTSKATLHQKAISNLENETASSDVTVTTRIKEYLQKTTLSQEATTSSLGESITGKMAVNEEMRRKPDDKTSSPKVMAMSGVRFYEHIRSLFNNPKTLESLVRKPAIHKKVQSSHNDGTSIPKLIGLTGHENPGIHTDNATLSSELTTKDLGLFRKNPIMSPIMSHDDAAPDQHQAMSREDFIAAISVMTSSGEIELYHRSDTESLNSSHARIDKSASALGTSEDGLHHKSDPVKTDTSHITTEKRILISMGENENHHKSYSDNVSSSPDTTGKSASELSMTVTSENGLHHRSDLVNVETNRISLEKSVFEHGMSKIDEKILQLRSDQENVISNPNTTKKNFFELQMTSTTAENRLDHRSDQDNAGSNTETSERTISRPEMTSTTGDTKLGHGTDQDNVSGSKPGRIEKAVYKLGITATGGNRFHDASVQQNVGSNSGTTEKNIFGLRMTSKTGENELHHRSDPVNVEISKGSTNNSVSELGMTKLGEDILQYRSDEENYISNPNTTKKNVSELRMTSTTDENILDYTSDQDKVVSSTGIIDKAVSELVMTATGENVFHHTSPQDNVGSNPGTSEKTISRLGMASTTGDNRLVHRSDQTNGGSSPDRIEKTVSELGITATGENILHDTSVQQNVVSNPGTTENLIFGLKMTSTTVQNELQHRLDPVTVETNFGSTEKSVSDLGTTRIEEKILQLASDQENFISNPDITKKTVSELRMTPTQSESSLHHKSGQDNISSSSGPTEKNVYDLDMSSTDENGIHNEVTASSSSSTTNKDVSKLGVKLQHVPLSREEIQLSDILGPFNALFLSATERYSLREEII